MKIVEPFLVPKVNNSAGSYSLSKASDQEKRLVTSLSQKGKNSTEKQVHNLT